MSKRGRGSESVSPDDLAEDGRLPDEGPAPVSAEFDRKWGATLVENTLAAVGDD